ncbi:fluoride efflux transporter CrcB [Campylobacter fetus]|uniref:Fluoride-specific ion channel FluC n=4 Tax=Campylobacter fetus TaxID=196 RepID=FLUC_CAMFF|nr:fluoride efflux transporter CrcB [Campylobacter fetus]A0RPI7.1 RecName: Full=Fluoride-specific ion channel FluC [Campylobacter fetus subsp. fetus 82-40]OCS23264.1 chromosome condensation protein CrcB [Campylobacter fetus subsp. venerealis cfvi97/532]OCS26799.1 chromosome condensation protein CrcB [Campylobacter fetus subsp. venerealis cfvB10]OCS30630.1 chromosome condensation protein CrcB [Campylobacter fetus subsp. venerealis LMG 6570 = CCUG 33900]OCS41307.1 chromosome condensation protein
MSFTTIFYIGFGGALGAILRSFTNGFVSKIFPNLSFPLGTLSVNIIGGFFIGFLMSLASNINIDINLKSFLVTGFLGGLTTFSTFSYENMLLLQSGNYTNAFLNIASNLLLSLLFCYFGFWIVKVMYA